MRHLTWQSWILLPRVSLIFNQRSFCFYNWNIVLDRMDLDRIKSKNSRQFITAHQQRFTFHGILNFQRGNWGQSMFPFSSFRISVIGTLQVFVCEWMSILALYPTKLFSFLKYCLLCPMTYPYPNVRAVEYWAKIHIFFPPLPLFVRETGWGYTFSMSRQSSSITCDATYSSPPFLSFLYCCIVILLS